MGKLVRCGAVVHLIKINLSAMETEDSFKLCDSSNSGHGSEIDHPCESASEAIISDSLPPNAQVIGVAPETMVDGLPESMDTLVKSNFVKQPDNSAVSRLVVGIEFTESVNSEHAEDGSLAVQSQSASDNHGSFSGIKRPRVTDDEHQQPSVHVVYSYLPRESKQKLEELLQDWSRWHSQSCSSSDGLNVTVESGEKTYFPALRIGLDKPSDVTFWVDNHTKTQSEKEFIPLDGTCVPLYDRGYSLALTSADGSCKMDRGVEKLDSSRCFNCGSYSHALKDCQKPRDNIAVNNARKQHKARKNQRANSRNSIRYYQSSRGGKYDGLAPGGLDANTRHALGLGELDPPPWLNRMREIGYPPGYLDPDVDAWPSGITIFGDVENEKKTEHGKSLDASFTEPSQKMTVEFPGINAPIPENADERLWRPPAFTRFHHSRESSHHRAYNHSSETANRWHYTDQRCFRDLEDDGPPGCDARISPSLSNHFRRHGDYYFGDYSLSPQTSPYGPWSSSYGRSFSDNGRRSPLARNAPIWDHIPRYGDYDYGYHSRSPQASPSTPFSPTYSRYFSDRDRRNPLVHDGSPNDGSYGTFPYTSTW